MALLTRSAPAHAHSTSRNAALLRGNVAVLAVVSLLNDVASEMIFPLLPLFLVGTLAATPTLLGLIEGVTDGLASALKLAGGWISDRARRRKPLIVAGYGIATVLRPLIAMAAAPWHVLALRAGDRVGKGLRTAPRDALLAESVPPDRRGAAFGLHRAFDHAGAVLGPLVATGILLLAPGRIRLVFALAAVPGLIALALVVLRLREVASTRPADPGTAADAAAIAAAHSDAGSGRVLSPELRAFLLIVLLFGIGNATDAFLLLRAAELGVPTAAVPLLWAALHVSKSAFSVPGGLLADRVGPHATIAAGWTFFAVVYAGFALADAAWHAWALFGAYGLFYGLTEAPEKTLVAHLAGTGTRGRAFGAYHLVIGLTAPPASLLFGVLWDRYGAPVAFAAGAACALLATLLLLTRSGLRTRRPVSHA